MPSARVRDFPLGTALVGTEKFYADNGTIDTHVTADQIDTFTHRLFSTQEWTDIRDYLPGGPRELLVGDDITSAVQAVDDNFNAGDAHRKFKIYIPRTRDNQSGAVIFDPASLTGNLVGASATRPWIWLMDVGQITLLSSWYPGDLQTLRGGINFASPPANMKGPRPRPLIQSSSTAWSSGAEPVLQMAGRNCSLENISVDANIGTGTRPTCAVKVGFDSQNIRRCFFSTGISDTPALWVESCFWINIAEICCAYNGASGTATQYSLLFATDDVGQGSCGLIRCRDITMTGGGVMFRATNDRVENIVIDELYCENNYAGQSLLNFDSTSGQSVGIILIRQPGLADSITPPTYVINNSGLKTSFITLQGTHRQENFSKQLWDPASNPIRGLFLDEACMDSSVDLNAGILDIYDGAGAGLTFGLPRTDTATGTSARLYCAPPGAPWNLGTILPVNQDPANWQLQSGGSITTGVAAPDGTTNAGSIVAANGARCMSTSLIPAVDDYILMGAWVKGTAAGTPVADVPFGISFTVAGWTLSGTASPNIGPQTGGLPLVGQDPFYNIDDNGWQYVSYLYKFSTVTGGSGTIRMFLYNGGTYCYPCAIHIPASVGMDAPTMLYHMNRLTSSTGGILSAASVAGDIVFPDLKNVMVKGKYVALTGLQTMWVPASAMTPRTTNGAAAASREISSITCGVLAFDQTTSEGANFSVTFPKSWNAGTVTFRPHWTTASSTGTVKWDLRGGSFADNVAIDVTGLGTKVGVTDTLQNVDRIHNAGTSTAVTLSNAVVDVPTYFEISRDTATDTLGSDAELIGIEIFYTTSAGNDA